MIKVFGTDFDGVIINIEPEKARLFGKLVNKYWNADSSSAARLWIAKGGTSRRDKFNYIYEAQYGINLSSEKYNAIESEYSNLLKNQFYLKLKPLPGSLELLQFARRNFDYTFVSSSVPMTEIKYLIEICGVNRYFDLVLGTNEKFPSKVEHFEEVKRRWNPEKIIFVADSPMDMKIAKEAGAVPIGILTNHPKSALISSGAIDTIKLPTTVSTLEKLLG